MASIDMADFKVWATKNGRDLASLDSRKAYEATLSTPGAARKNDRKHVKVRCIAKTKSGEELFRSATVPNLLTAKRHFAEVAIFEALESGAVSAYCETAELIDLSDE